MSQMRRQRDPEQEEKKQFEIYKRLRKDDAEVSIWHADANLSLSQKLCYSARLKLDIVHEDSWLHILSEIKKVITPNHERGNTSVDPTAVIPCLMELCKFGALDIMIKFLDAFPTILVTNSHTFYLIHAVKNHTHADSQNAAGVVIELLRRYPDVKFHNQLLNLCADKTEPGYSFKPKLRQIVLADAKLMFKVLTKKIPVLYDIMAKPTPKWGAMWGKASPEVAQTIGQIEQAFVKALGIKPENVTHALNILKNQPSMNYESYCHHTKNLTGMSDITMELNGGM